MRRNHTCIKHIIHIAIGSILIASCSKTDIVDEQRDRMPMQFRVPAAATKAVVSNDIFQQKGTAFKVWGNYRISDNSSYSTVFDGTKVTNTGSGWTYDNPQFWFPGCTYTFRAVYPSDIPQVTLENAAFQIRNFDASTGTDLLLAAPAAIHCGAGQKMPPVQLHFRHLLSRVVFFGRSDEKHLGKGRLVVVDEAKLYGIHTTGKWNGTGADGTWTPEGTATDTGNTPFLIDKAAYPSGLTLQPGGTNLFTHELFIPQELDACELAVTFHYNVGEPKSFTSTVRLSSVSKQWESGKSYRYPFTIDEHIFFATPRLEPWEYAPVHNTDFNIDHLQD